MDHDSISKLRERSEWKGFQQYAAFLIFKSDVCRLLTSEFEKLLLPEVIAEYSEMEYAILKNATDCKAKDFTRGIHVDSVGSFVFFYMEEVNP